MLCTEIGMTPVTRRGQLMSDLLCICKIAGSVTGELADAYWANAALHTGDSCSNGSLAQTPACQLQ